MENCFVCLTLTSASEIYVGKSMAAIWAIALHRPFKPSATFPQLPETTEHKESIIPTMRCKAPANRTGAGWCYPPYGSDGLLLEW